MDRTEAALQKQRDKDMDLFQEGRLHPEVLGHHVEAEEVSVDASPGHGHAAELLVLFCGCAEQTPAHICCLEGGRTAQLRIKTSLCLGLYGNYLLICCTRRHLSALQGFDEGTALVAAGANRLGPAFPEQTGHGGLVRQAERPPVLQRIMNRENCESYKSYINIRSTYFGHTGRSYLITHIVTQLENVDV